MRSVDDVRLSSGPEHSTLCARTEVAGGASFINLVVLAVLNVSAVAVTSRIVDEDVACREAHGR